MYAFLLTIYAWKSLFNNEYRNTYKSLKSANHSLFLNTMREGKYSFYSYCISVLLLLYVAFVFYPKWNNESTESPLGYDAVTYYWYLPATFIYKDLKQQKFGDSIITKYGFTSVFDQSYTHESGNRVITYSSGVAILQLPAFAVAHVLAKPLGFEPDGFSKPYRVALQAWGLLWVLVGLWFFRKLLLYYFTDKTTAITLLLLVYGSNYLNYSAIDITLTHSWLFVIYVFLLLNTRQFYKQPSRKYAVRIGLLTGLLILIRPSEFLAVLIPLLWGMESISWGAIKERVAFFAHQYRYLFIAVVCAAIVGSIQVIYWLYVTGQPLVYSYDDKGFSWKSPHFWLYTFSYRSGWLVYTPMLFFVFIGLVPFLFKGKNKVAVISFFLLYYYLVSAWDIWWYGGMGGRAMVHSYAVLFLIIATLVEYLLATKWIKWPAIAIMLLFTYVNIWFTYNAHAGQGLYDPSSMTKDYYWAVVGRFKVPEYTVRYKDTDEYFNGEPKSLLLMHQYGFEDDTSETNIEPISGQRSVFIDVDREYSPVVRMPYSNGSADWIRAKANLRLTCWEWENWRMVQFIVSFIDEKNEFVKRRMIRLNRATGKWETQIYFDVKIPEEHFSAVEVQFWNPGTTCPVMVDDVEIWSFSE